MPVSIVIGGQFGSEGKGKTALELVRRSREEVVTMRVGGPDTEHISYDGTGNQHTFRQLPASCIDKDVDVVFPAGSYYRRRYSEGHRPTGGLARFFRLEHRGQAGVDRMTEPE